MEKHYYSILQKTLRVYKNGNATIIDKNDYDEVAKSYSKRDANELFNLIKKQVRGKTDLSRKKKETLLVEVNISSGEQNILRAEEWEAVGNKIRKV